MTTEPIQAGSSVQSACRKCKTVTDHHVVVILEDKIGKVQCKVCGGKHAYRPPKTPAASQAVQPGARAEKNRRAAADKMKLASKKPSPEAHAHWESMVGSAAPEIIRPYAMTGMFLDGDIIQHSVFGRGYVQRFMKPNMIEVLFADGVKLLRCCAQLP